MEESQNVAITQPDITMWQNLKVRGLLFPANPKVLEIGEANWFQDCTDPNFTQLNRMEDSFEAARSFYRVMLGYSKIEAVDLQGKTALKCDLNFPHPSLGWNGGWDIVINTGTTEHVFDQSRVFRSIHDWTAMGGLMVHCAPHFLKHHGFYNYNPCLFDDIAAANGYEKLYGRVEEFQGGEVLCLAYRKMKGGEFAVPYQRSLGLEKP